MPGSPALQSSGGPEGPPQAAAEAAPESPASSVSSVCVYEERSSPEKSLLACAAFSGPSGGPCGSYLQRPLPPSPAALGGPRFPGGPPEGRPGFSELWEAWKETACCLHSLSRVAAYPSALEVFGPALGISVGSLAANKQQGLPAVLAPHFSEADKAEYPNAKAVLSYRAFKRAGSLCPPAFARCFTPTVFCEFLRDAHGDISTQTAARNLLNSIFNVHLKEKMQPYLNDKEEITMQSLSLLFMNWAEDEAFATLAALKEENNAAHPGLLEFFARFLAVRLFFAVDVGRRGLVNIRDLLDFEEFQQLLNSLYKPLGSPLGDTPAQWSVQFAYDIFNFLRERGYMATEGIVAELLEALSSVVCPYTYDVTLLSLQRLFAAKTTRFLSAQEQQTQNGISWTEWEETPQQQQQQQQQQEQQQQQQHGDEEQGEGVFSLSTEDLIRFLAALDYCAAVWSPTPSKSRIAAPSCIAASLKFLWEVLDVEKKGVLDRHDINELWQAVSASLTVRGFPAGCLLKGSVELELLDRLMARGDTISRRSCLSNHTQGRMLILFLISPAFFQLFDQREHCPGAPLLPGDPVSPCAEALASPLPARV